MSRKSTYEVSRLFSRGKTCLAKRERGLPQLMVAGRRARGGERSRQQPFAPPEDWHEPTAWGAAEYRVVVQPPGDGFRHVVTPQEIRERLATLPGWMLAPLSVIQFSRMTRKKQLSPCYGMQWGQALYLYPIAADFVEQFTRPPLPAQQTEAKMFGARWESASDGTWRLVWTEQAVRDYYLNNVLIHEPGHLLDDRNTAYADRESYAEWFAIRYGYRPTRSSGSRGRKPVRRHHGK